MKKLLLFIILLSNIVYVRAEENEAKEEKNGKTFLSVLLDRVDLSGYGQFGYTYNSYNPAKDAPTNTFDIKRIIFVANANITKKLNMALMYDFATAMLHEFWGEYHFNDAFVLKAGQFKTPFTIESNLSPAVLEIISGAQGIQYLAGIDASDICYGGNAGRDLGIMLWGKFVPYKEWKLMEYRIGLFNGQGPNKLDKNNHKDVVGMLTVNPFREVSLVGSFHIGQGYASDNNLFGAFNKGENYTRNRWSVGGEMNLRPMYLRAEYLEGKDTFVQSRGAYAVASIHVHPKWDIIASCDYFDKNTNMAEAWQSNYIVGAQWNFFRRCRLQLQYVYQQRGESLKNSNLIMSQVQLGF